VHALKEYVTAGHLMKWTEIIANPNYDYIGMGKRCYPKQVMCLCLYVTCS